MTERGRRRRKRKFRIRVKLWLAGWLAAICPSVWRVWPKGKHGKLFLASPETHSVGSFAPFSLSLYSFEAPKPDPLSVKSLLLPPPLWRVI